MAGCRFMKTLNTQNALSQHYFITTIINMQEILPHDVFIVNLRKCKNTFIDTVTKAVLSYKILF